MLLDVHGDFWMWSGRLVAYLPFRSKSNSRGAYRQRLKGEGEGAVCVAAVLGMLQQRQQRWERSY